MDRYFSKDDINFMWIVVVCAIGTFGFLTAIGAL